MKAMVYDTSLLDPVEGIKFKGNHSIPEICRLAPKAPGGDEPLPEAVFWLLLTGDFPTAEENAQFQDLLRERAHLPSETIDMIYSLPRDTHPMTQLSMSILRYLIA